MRNAHRSPDNPGDRSPGETGRNFGKGAAEMPARNTIPLAVKLAYTLFVAVLVSNYWRTYSPWTFLFFCDVALLLTLPALWLESPLL